MHRLLVQTETLQCGEPALPDAARRHLKVVRPKEGEQIELFDGRGSWRVYAWREGRLSAVAGIASAPPPPCGLTLFACVTKGSRWDWTIEKATELGVTRIVPVLSERTIVRIPPPERAVKRRRWQRIAEDAARQSDAKWLPEVAEAVDFAAALALARESVCYAGALCNPPPRTILGELRENPPPQGRELSVFVGPEGDFTPDELSSLLEFASPVSFGSTILRAETAAIYGVSVLKSLLDERTEKAS